MQNQRTEKYHNCDFVVQWSDEVIAFFEIIKQKNHKTDLQNENYEQFAENARSVDSSQVHLNLKMLDNVLIRIIFLRQLQLG